MAEATGYDISGAIGQVNGLIIMMQQIANKAPKRVLEKAPKLEAIISKFKSDMKEISKPGISREVRKKNYIKLIIYYGLLIYALYQLAPYEKAAMDYVSKMPTFLSN